MVTQKTPKNAIKFHCEKCNFTCIKNSDWCRHLTTAKHKKITNGNDFTPKTPTNLNKYNYWYIQIFLKGVFF